MKTAASYFIKNLDGTSKWDDWRWQQRNSLNSAEKMIKFFPNFPEDEMNRLVEGEKKFRFSLTPYSLSLIKVDSEGNPLKTDPLWKQFSPISEKPKPSLEGEYDGSEINWGEDDNSPTPCSQHIYPRKMAVRIVNNCLGYCKFCFEIKRTIDKQVDVPSSNPRMWEETLNYTRENPQIEEIIISGGDPLILKNGKLEEIIKSVREIKSIKSVRLNTRALTFNPYRFDEGLIDLMRDQKVTGIGIHISHPREITDEFKKTLKKFDDRGYGNILKLAQTPLLKGVNDDKETLHDLFMGLYSECGILPYYLLHDMPFTRETSSLRTSVKKGVELIKSLKRKVPNPAVPEYIIVHKKGKQSVPLEIEGTPEFQYDADAQGNPIIRFKNWKGNWETYLDGKD